MRIQSNQRVTDTVLGKTACITAFSAHYWFLGAGFLFYPISFMRLGASLGGNWVVDAYGA
jgi:hypothetical protein